MSSASSALFLSKGTCPSHIDAQTCHGLIKEITSSSGRACIPRPASIHQPKIYCPRQIDHFLLGTVDSRSIRDQAVHDSIPRGIDRGGCHNTGHCGDRPLFIEEPTGGWRREYLLRHDDWRNSCPDEGSAVGIDSVQQRDAHDRTSISRSAHPSQIEWPSCVFVYVSPGCCFQVCLMAFEVCTVGIKTLKCTTECCRFYEEHLMPAFPKSHPEASVATVDVPQLSAVISPLWKSLMVAMKRRPVAMVEGVLKFFGDMASVFDGRLLSRRFTDEAWPLLKTLLDQGHAQPAVQRILPHGGTFSIVQEAACETAPLSKICSQMAALQCLERIGQDATARSCLKSKFSEIVPLLFSFLSSNHASEIQQKASETLKAISQVDADYVWAVLIEQPREIPYWQELWSFLDSAEIAWHQRLRETVLST